MIGVCEICEDPTVDGRRCLACRNAMAGPPMTTPKPPTKMTRAEREILRDLVQALAPFKAVYRLNEPLSAGWPDDKSNRDFMPGAWPDWADFRRAAEAHERARVAFKIKARP